MKALINRTIKRLEKEKTALAKNRDSMREFLGEIEDLVDHANSAIEDLECAIDKLSELV